MKPGDLVKVKHGSMKLWVDREAYGSSCWFDRGDAGLVIGVARDKEVEDVLLLTKNGIGWIFSTNLVLFGEFQDGRVALAPW